jgi:hypothetical protein
LHKSFVQPLSLQESATQFPMVQVSATHKPLYGPPQALAPGPHWASVVQDLFGQFEQTFPHAALLVQISPPFAQRPHSVPAVQSAYTSLLHTLLLQAPVALQSASFSWHSLSATQGVVLGA